MEIKTNIPDVQDTAMTINGIEYSYGDYVDVKTKERRIVLEDEDRYYEAKEVSGTIGEINRNGFFLNWEVDGDYYEGFIPFFLLERITHGN